MGRRKTNESNVRKLTRVGKGSLAVTIPVAIVRKLKLRNKQKVIVTERAGKLTVKDWK